MKQYQISFTDSEDFSRKLTEIKNACDGTAKGDVIFYLTWTDNAKAGLNDVTGEIESQFPDAPYFGNEASGNIAMGEFTFGIQVTCYAFEEEDSRTELVWVEEGSELSSLKDLWDYCKKKEGLRAIEMIPSMSYVGTLSIDGNVPDIGSDVLLFGGASVNYDNATYDADIIAKGHPKTKDGMAVMLYFGKSLNFHSTDVLGWKGLGRLMEVTDSTGKCIKMIDNLPAYSVYEKYLNLTMEDKDTLVFPLIVDDEGTEYIRTPQTIMPDKSMQMFADIPKGTKVRISYGDKNTILDSINAKAEEIAGFNPEAIKAYSCAARRLFWGDDEVSKETLPLENITPVCGFYTGGEILRFGSKLRVLNQTLSLVCLREGEGKTDASAEVMRQGEDKSLISRLTYFTKKVVEEERAQRLLAGGLEKVLSAEYQVMYYINLHEGAATMLHGDQEAQKFIPIFNTNDADVMFDNFHKFYVDTAVVEEDRQRVKAVMNAENMNRVLKDSPSMSVNFRVRRNLVDPVYMEMRMFKAGEEDGRIYSVVLAFRSSDEELTKALELNERLQHEILDEMLSDDEVFLIDCVNDTRKTIHDRLDGSDKYSDEDKYYYSFSKYVDTYVAQADKEMMRLVASPSYMLERLKDEKEYTVQYRDTTSGIQRYYEMRVVRFSDTEVIQSFVEKDREIVERMIFNKLEDDYFAVYGIDLDSGLFQVMKESEMYHTGEEGTVTPYAESMLKFASLFKGETREFFEELSNIDFISKKFEKEDKSSFIFSTELGGEKKWINVTQLVLVRHEDGKPSVFALGFSFLDEEAAKVQDFQARLKEDAQIIGALSKDFGIVSYVELMSDKSNDTAVDLRISKLARRLMPEWERVSNFSDKLDVLMNTLVYEPDREEFYKETRRENILNELNTASTYFVNTRCLVEGEVRYYQIQYSAVRDRENVLGVVAGIRSIDEQMKKEIEAQKQLESALDAAEVANKSKSTFLFNMSHDIRTPMNAIKGFTAMAKKYTEDTEKVKEYLDKIDISGQQLLTLINQVLEMSRIESGKIELEEKPVNIQERFDSMVTVISSQAKLKGLDFHYALQDVSHYNVIADDSRMGQVTLNIAGNAIKYTPEGGSINFVLREIPGRREGYGSYTLTVEDTGIGMSEEYIGNIFEPFSREKNSTVSKIQGTGLGMSIVKSIVDLMGGNIEVKSVQGKGTRFDVTIDFKLAEKDKVVPDLTDGKVVLSFEGRRVLLVEDNEMNREIAKDILEEYGFIVEEADDGDVAVDMCRRIVERADYSYYDFILMDIQMPRMNGYDATRAIRALPSPENIRVPIIAMTANAFEEDRQNAINAGMDEHLAKPVDIQKLLETLSRFT